MGDLGNNSAQGTTEVGTESVSKPGAQNTAEAGNNTEKMLTQAEVDRVVQERIAREREKFADYEDLKVRAEKLAEIEESQKSETEREREQREELESELVEARKALESERTNTLRAQVAAEKQVPLANLTGSTREELEASADALLAWRGSQEPAPWTPNKAPDQSGAKVGSVEYGRELAKKFI